MAEPEDIPPDVHAESQGQRLATSGEQRALVASADSAYPLSDSLSGLAASRERLPLNQVGLTLLITMVQISERAAESAARERDLAQKARDQMQERAHKAELRAASAESKLDIVDLRLLLNSLGCVLLGLVPYVHEKLGSPGSITFAALGGLLVIGAFVIYRKGRD
jgi:hypothetical protein